MIQLQTQVQELQDAVAHLQQSNDERMGVIKDLVQQTADSVNKMSVIVNGLKLRCRTSRTPSAQNHQLSGQVQSLNDSVDELKARLTRMEKSLSDIQSQQQSTNAALSNLPQAAPRAVPPATGAQFPPARPRSPGTAPTTAAAGPSRTSPGQPNTTLATNPSQRPPRQPSPPPTTCTARLRDYMAARYSLATSEFSDLVKAYPDDNLSGNAFFYLGEMEMRTHKPSPPSRTTTRSSRTTPATPRSPPPSSTRPRPYRHAPERSRRTRAPRPHPALPRLPRASQARAKLNSLRASAVTHPHLMTPSDPEISRIAMHPTPLAPLMLVSLS